MITRELNTAEREAFLRGLKHRSQDATLDDVPKYICFTFDGSVGYGNTLAEAKADFEADRAGDDAGTQ